MRLRADIYDELMWAAREYQQPASLIGAIIQTESNWNPDAIGDNGTSFGLMQINVYGAGFGYSGQALLNIHTNLSVGTAYLVQCLNAFNLDPVWAISAYNQGIEGTWQRGPEFNWGYVQDVLNNWERFKAEGFEREVAYVPPPPIPYQFVRPPNPSDIDEIRYRLGQAGWGGGSDYDAVVAFLGIVVTTAGDLPLINRLRYALGLDPIGIGPPPTPPIIMPPPPEYPPITPPGGKAPPTGDGPGALCAWVGWMFATVGSWFMGAADVVGGIPVLAGRLDPWFRSIGVGMGNAEVQMVALGVWLEWVLGEVGRALNPGDILARLVNLRPEIGWDVWSHLDNLAPWLSHYWWGWGLDPQQFIDRLWGWLVNSFPILQFDPMGLLEWLRGWIESWWPQIAFDPWQFVSWQWEALTAYFPMLDFQREPGEEWWRTWLSFLWPAWGLSPPDFVNWATDGLKTWIDARIEDSIEWVQSTGARALAKMW